MSTVFLASSCSERALFLEQFFRGEVSPFGSQRKPGTRSLSGKNRASHLALPKASMLPDTPDRAAANSRVAKYRKPPATGQDGSPTRFAVRSPTFQKSKDVSKAANAFVHRAPASIRSAGVSNSARRSRTAVRRTGHTCRQMPNQQTRKGQGGEKLPVGRLSCPFTLKAPRGTGALISSRYAVPRTPRLRCAHRNRNCSTWHCGSFAREAHWACSPNRILDPDFPG